MASIRPKDEPAITAVAAGDIFLIDGTSGVRALDASKVVTLAATQTLTAKTLTSPVVSGGTIDSAVIGGTTPAAGTFSANTTVADGGHGGGQITVKGATDANRQVWFGYDTTLDKGFMQSIHQTVSNTDLMFQPNGGNVRIGDTGAATATLSSSGSIDAGSSILSAGAAGGIGYKTGAGGAVTQLTGRTTGVTLNKTTGAITLFAAAAVVGTWVSFTVTNSAVAATDTPVVSVKSGTNTYVANVSAVAAGSFQISFMSIVGTASDSPVINFAVLKAVAS